MAIVGVLAAHEAHAQSISLSPASTAVAPDLEKRLAAIDAAIEDKRKALGVAGAALAIVKDDKIIYAKGFGLRDVEKNLAATAQTRFAIGSISKSFTAMAAVMAADDGKLSLDDAPAKFLPSFKVGDAEIDAQITLRDLLSHRSGVERTDLVFLLNALTRDELIQGIRLLKPVAKLRQQFHYQNLMYVAAGDAIGLAEATSYEDFVAKRIFEPLNMTSANFSGADLAVGYYRWEGAQKVAGPFDAKVIAAAGGINASARDMAQWVRFILGEGVVEGKRLVSEKNFNELLKAHIAVNAKTYYGLGWFLHGWNGRRVVEHGGNLPGFTAQAGLMPSQKLGFVLLTNSSYSLLGEFAMETVWANLADPVVKIVSVGTASQDVALDAGAYAFPGGADFKVAIEGSGLTLTVPGQPKYALEPVGKHRYKLGAPAPSGFFATFRRASHAASGVEMFLEQPQGNVVLPKRVDAPLSGRAASLAELVTIYKAANGQLVEIANMSGNIALVVPGQAAYPLVEQTKDTFALGGLPSGKWSLTVNRGADDRIASLVLNQPNGTFEFVSTAVTKADISVEALHRRVIEAHGGAANLRKHRSLTITCEVELEGQGILGPCTIYNKAPRASAMDISLSAFGKLIANTHQYFDGAIGGEQRKGEAVKPFSAQALEYVKLDAEFDELLDWKTLYKDVAVTGKQRLGADEVYLVVKTTAGGLKVTDYYSTKTFLQLRHDAMEWNDDLKRGLPVETSFSDYRGVDGVQVAFQQVAIGGVLAGKRILRLKEIVWDAPIGDEVFRAQ